MTTSDDHELATGDWVTLAGADQVEYGGIYQVTVTGDTTFTVEVAGAPTTPATGTITARPCKPPLVWDGDVTHDFAVVTTGAHPMRLIRDQLNDVWPAEDLKRCANGQRVTIAGAVTCRQRPGTASGVVFVTLEDESGTANAIIWPALFERFRLVINLEPALMITGKLQNESGVIHVVADIVEPLPAFSVPVNSSHDYH